MNAEARSAENSHAQREDGEVAMPPRRPLYFDSGERRLFGWFHAAAPQERRDCAVVICNPLGYEYTHSHRSLRHAAESFAARGIATLRFDYDATGDSPGDDLAPNRVPRWLEDIRSAIDTTRALSGCHRVCLLGVRMGAALAALSAAENGVDHLVLWNPCSGKPYVREIKALARAAARDVGSELGFEGAGFVLLHETAEQLSAIDLFKMAFRPECDVLLVQRDDIDADERLQQHLQQQGVDAMQIAVPGYADMMAEPQFTAVPTVAIARIADWLTGRTPPLTTPPAEPGFTPNACATTFQGDTELTERFHQFGAHDRLFGIETCPAAQPVDDARPAIVLLNSGSVHRVGPNRLYVTLARRLAALGFRCFRFDLRGLGDSATADGGIENHPYQATATADAESALQLLQNAHGCRRFVLAGLCSGAHTAFHAGVELAQYDIREIVLINPLTYRYVEGMSLETTQHFMDVAYYKGSARKLSSWLKLLRGKVDIGNLIGLALSQVRVMSRTLLDYQRENLFRQPTTQLSADLRKLFAQNRPLTLFIASGEAGYSLLVGGAKYMATRGLKSGMITAQFIPDSNHTFSQFASRMKVIERICTHVNSRFGAGDNSTQ